MRFLASDTLTLSEISAPTPKPNEVRIRVFATALNRADLLQRAGKYPPPAGESEILGLEVAGEVESIGSDVTLHRVGDRVMALLTGGGYAELAVAHEAVVMPLPASLSFEEAAAIPEAFLTAHHALSLLAEVRRNEAVLIHAGASGVGTAAIQLMREAGATVFVTASAAKHSMCQKLGASYTYDYQQGNFANALLADAPAGVDVILDPVGAPYWEQNIQLLRTDGKLVLLAAMAGSKIEHVSLAPILLKRLSIMGTTLRNRPVSEKIALVQSFWRYAKERFADKTLVPVIDAVYDWTRANNAHERMGNNLNTGKIVLKIT